MVARCFMAFQTIRAGGEGVRCFCLCARPATKVSVGRFLTAQRRQATLYELKRATPADIIFVVNLLSGSAKTGVDAVERLLNTFAVSEIWAARHRKTHETAALWGLARFDEEQSDIGTDWMLALAPLDTDSQEVRSLSHLVVLDMLDHCEVLENYVDVTSCQSIQFLRELGFSIGPAELDERSGRILTHASLCRAHFTDPRSSRLPN